MGAELAVTCTIQAHSQMVSACTFSPDGSRLVTSGRDEEAKVWDVETGELVHELKVHCDPLYDCAWAGNGAVIATAGDEPALALFDAATGECLHEIWPAGFGLAFGCAFSPDSSLLYAASSDSGLWAFDIRTGEEAWSDFPEDRSELNFVEASPDGALLACGDYMGLLLIEAGSRKIRLDHEYMRPEEMVDCCAFFPYGKRLLFGTRDGCLGVLDTVSGSLLAEWRHRAGCVRDCAVSEDGRLIVCSTGGSKLDPEGQLLRYPSEIVVRHAVTGSLLAQFRHDCDVTCVSMDPVGMKLAFGDADGTLRLVSLAPARQLL